MNNRKNETKASAPEPAVTPQQVVSLLVVAENGKGKKAPGLGVESAMMAAVTIMGRCARDGAACKITATCEETKNTVFEMAIKKGKADSRIRLPDDIGRWIRRDQEEQEGLAEKAQQQIERLSSKIVGFDGRPL